VISDEQRQRVADAREAYKIRLSAGMRRHRAPPEPSDDVADGEVDQRAVSYDAMKRRLSGAWKVRRAPRPVDPSWQKL
jgi:hypothetical protein